MAARVLFPKTGFTTEDLVSLYDQLAPVLLPHLAARPLTLKRFPAGIHGEAFWEKDAPNFTPKWIKRLPVPRKHENTPIHYITLDNVKSLRWAASIGCIEIHSFLHRYPYITSPTLIAFDLDPCPGTGLPDCCAVALDIRDWFRRWKLQSFAKVSGSKGIQVYVPLNTPSSYDITHTIARKVAEDLAQRSPDTVISEMARAERTGKVFIDWSQNAEHKTTVSVYSVRAKQEEPFVSMPITWKEVQQAVKTHRSDHLIFPPDLALQRTSKLGDIFGPVLTLQQRIPRRLASELQLDLNPQPERVKIHEPRKSAQTAPRSSGQGGRRLFLVQLRDSTYQLAIEHRDQFRLYQFPNLPARKSEAVSGQATGIKPMSYAKQPGQPTAPWDLGTYELFEGSLDRGRATIYFSGQRMNGPWGLTRESDTWTLTNADGHLKPEPPAMRTAHSPRASSARPRAILPGTNLKLSELPQAEPRFIRKMDCVSVNDVSQIPASAADWFREIKWDGYRVCIIKRGKEVDLRTKSNLPPGARYQHIADALSRSKLPDCVLDAELVALDAEGRPSFQLLQQSRHNQAEIVVYVFDILNYTSRNLMQLPLQTRRDALQALVPLFPPPVRLSEFLPEDAPISALVAALDEQRLEGIIVKRKTSRYREGTEPGTWIKHRLYKIGEFVIGGYLKRHDPWFDAIIVGERKRGKLLYKEKVRFGFDDEKKAALLPRMDALRVRATPFDNLPERTRRGSLDADEMREAVWIKPDLRCTVEYTERTEAGNIRGHGRFGQLLL